MEEQLRQIVQEIVNESKSMEIWIPAVVSIITLLVNMFFYIFVQPRLTYKTTAKESLTKVSVELLNYLAEIVSYEDFTGVPTKIRKYSLQIHLQFKNGTAKGDIELNLEKVFQEIQKRKQLSTEVEIEKWNEGFRVLVRDLRKSLAKYCGSF